LLLGRLAKAGRATRLRTAAVELWVAAERLAQLLAIYPQARPTPALQLPATLGDGWSAEDALLELLRARLTGFARAAGTTGRRPGPGRGGHRLRPRLEREGYVLRGRFSPGASEDEWCERHLLARIRYTVRRLRREIEPVERADYLRFLFDWQRVAAGARAAPRRWPEC
jgi:ATP-dependent Lhr-like helicase